MYRIGSVYATTPGPQSHAFRQGLRELGYVEGNNIIVEERFAEGRFERFPEIIAELIRLKVDVRRNWRVRFPPSVRVGLKE